jgi:hypothetical protein
MVAPIDVRDLRRRAAVGRLIALLGPKCAEADGKSTGPSHDRLIELENMDATLAVELGADFSTTPSDMRAWVARALAAQVWRRVAGLGPALILAEGACGFRPS